jgi:tight adherence protein C
MFGENTTLILYGIMGLAVIMLIVRLYLRRKKSKSQTVSSLDPVENNITMESAVEKVESSISETIDPKPVSIRNSESSWEGQKLFSNITNSEFNASNPIPKVEPHEVPDADKSDYYFGSVTPVLASMMPESSDRKEDLKKELQQAGYYQPHAWHNLSAIRYVAIIGSMLFFGALLLFMPKQAEMPLLGMMVVSAVLGWALPSLYIKSKAAERASEIERGMPDMLDMLNMCVSQGLTVPQSLKRISQDLKPVYPELAKELTIVYEQSEVGDMQQALTNFSQRTDLPDVRSLTSLLNQTERMGTSVSHALVEYSDSMREHLRQRADEKANQASFKLLFPIALCMLPAVFLILLGPATVEMANFFKQGGTDILSGGRQAIENLNQ